jgi:hypothetical protein
MRSVRTAVVGACVVVVVGLVTACYPPSQAPVGQPIPPGGRVVATIPALTYSWIEDATDDLSSIVYATTPFVLELGRQPYRFWVYDDDAGTTVEVPVGGVYGEAALSPDGGQVAFTSNDVTLQSGPVAANCIERPMWQPVVHHVCHEVYVVDLSTWEVRQLTGLEGSSPVTHSNVRFTEDGSALLVDSLITGSYETASPTHLRIDLTSGVTTEVPAETPVESWDRGTHQVAWDSASGTLTSVETGTGDVTTLWSDPEVYSLRSALGGGRHVVLSRWINDQVEVFRLVDTDDGTVTDIPSPWVSDDAERFAVMQQNVAPDGTDRLIIAPLLR